MKSLAEITAFYCQQHQNRIDKLIEKEPLERYKESLREQKKYYSPQTPSVITLLTNAYQSLQTRQPADLCRFSCLSINKALWKTVSYCLGIPTFKTESSLTAWMKEYYGEAYTAWQLSQQQARMQKAQRRQQEEAQRRLEAIEETGTQQITISKQPTTIAEFARDYYAKGWRVIKKQNSIAYTYQICETSTGSYFVNPRGKRNTRYAVNVWKDYVIPYFLHYQQQQEKITATQDQSKINNQESSIINPSPTSPALPALPPTTTSEPATTEPSNIIPFPTSPPVTSDRQPLTTRFPYKSNGARTLVRHN